MRQQHIVALLALAALLVAGVFNAQAAGNNRVYLPALAAPQRPTATPTPGRPTATPAPSPTISPTPGRQNELRTGQATYYDATGDGNCMLGPSPNDLMVAAISHQDYGVPINAAYCGAYVQVTGELGSVIVRIVDKCPDPVCTSGHLDLSPQAFARIAPLAKGIVPITWRVVSPPISGTISYRFKEGSSQWWTAVQVRNHRNPLAKLEYRNAAGQWINAPREDYNYFVAPSGMGPGPYTFRVTDVYGNVLTDSNVPLREAQVVSGSGQFPVGP